MSQFEHSNDDYMFDLDAEEFSLESILDEYKDYDPSRPDPAPKPQSGFASRPVDAALIEAEQQAQDMKDEFVSVEHLFLAIVEKPNGPVKTILN